MKVHGGIHVEGGAMCAACRRPRPYADLLAFGRAEDITAGRRPAGYVCRPSVSDMRFPLCTSRALASAAVHAIALAAQVHDRADSTSRPKRDVVPEHIRNYTPVLTASS